MPARVGTEKLLQLEEACFAHYRERVASIGPESLPRIRRPKEVWKYVAFRHVRIDPMVKDTVVIYVVPEWDEDNHMEWCVQGTNKLVYAGEFVGGPVSVYKNYRNRRTKR